MTKKKSKTGVPATSTQSALIPPEMIEQLRKSVFHTVKSQNQAVREVLAGRRTWSNQQVKLYLDLLGKVMPSLTQSHATVEHVDRPIENLSKDELRQLIAKQMAGPAAAKKAAKEFLADAPAIEVEFKNLDEGIAASFVPLSPEEEKTIK